MIRAKCGTWVTPISSQSVIEAALSFRQISVDNDIIYWSEARPQEKGRTTIMQRVQSGEITDLLPQKFSARSRVHEYGGGEFTVHNGKIFFVNDADQNIYSIENGKVNTIFCDASKRFAQLLIDPEQRFLYYVVEDHHHPEDVQNYLGRVDLKSFAFLPIATGKDFYGNLSLDQNGKQLAWISWNHPNMPWNRTELWKAQVCPKHGIKDPQQQAGNGEESIIQPQFGPDGLLYYLSDRSGFWNIYRLRNHQEECLYSDALEFGEPQWMLGGRRFTFLKNFINQPRLAVIFTNQAVDSIGIIDVLKKSLTPIPTEMTSIGGFCSTIWTIGSDCLVFQAASPKSQNAIMIYHQHRKTFEIVRKSKIWSYGEEFISEGKMIEFPTENHQKAFGFFYAPKNPDYTPLKHELPPVIVRCHGGPSGHVANQLQMETQFWTSRGIAVFYVNYGGSTGFGRDYRNRLNNNWGIVDVNDCYHGAKHLIRQGLVDELRVVIKGSSAGGFTALAALCFKDIFCAGVIYYGVSDLNALVKETHKFESHYLETLIGPYQNKKTLYDQRSPIHNVERINVPLLIFQGGKDRVVPVSQAEKMQQALLKRNVPVDYVLFPEESHGFRQAETKQKALLHELKFYSEIFFFSLKDSEQ